MSDIEQTPFTFNEFTENPEPRCACLLLDTSGSMGGAPIRELNEGLKAFRQELSQDSLAMKRVEDANCVVGDVNHGSILVAQDATVALIDCDSFEVNGNFAERRSSFRKIEICNRGLCKLSTMLSTATVRRRRHQADPTGESGEKFKLQLDLPGSRRPKRRLCGGGGWNPCRALFGSD